MTTSSTNGSPDEDHAQDGMMSEAVRVQFEEEIARLRASNNAGPADRRMAVAGVVAAVVGIVIVLIAYRQTMNYSDQRDQMESLVLALLGIALVVLGSVVYLRNSLTRFMRFWLLRTIYEQRDVARALSASSTTNDTDPSIPPR